MSDKDIKGTCEGEDDAGAIETLTRMPTSFLVAKGTIIGTIELVVLVVEALEEADSGSESCVGLLVRTVVEVETG